MRLVGRGGFTTLAKAQRICGLTIQVAINNKDFVAQAMDGSAVIAKIAGRNLKTVFGLLVEKVYAINRQKAMERDGYRCSSCGRIGVPLQAHHVIHRARGQRDDSVANISMKCAACHSKEHGG